MASKFEHACKPDALSSTAQSVKRHERVLQMIVFVGGAGLVVVLYVVVYLSSPKYTRRGQSHSPQTTDFGAKKKNSPLASPVP